MSLGPGQLPGVSPVSCSLTVIAKEQFTATGARKADDGVRINGSSRGAREVQILHSTCLHVNSMKAWGGQGEGEGERERGRGRGGEGERGGGRGGEGEGEREREEEGERECGRGKGRVGGGRERRRKFT